MFVVCWDDNKVSDNGRNVALVVGPVVNAPVREVSFVEEFLN